MSTIRVAALQLRAHDRAEYPRTREAILRRIDEAAESCELLAVPEGTFPAYVLGSAPLCEDAARADVEALREIARRRACVIVAGIALPGETGVANAALAIDSDGRVAGRAEKIFLWHFDRQWFSAGNSIAAVDTSIGRIGMLVCADGRMPGIARALVDDGAQLLVMPTAWVTSGRNRDALENVQADLLARVRAYENGVPFVAANKCGTERAMVAYCGKSQIVDANGDIVAIAGEQDEAIVSGHVAIDAARPQRSVRHELERIDVLPQAQRVALSVERYDDIPERMAILETDVWISAEQRVPEDALQRLGAAQFYDDALHDPMTALEARRAGYRALLWHVADPTPWTVTIARARALELRMYVMVIDGTKRAYAVDPDGVVICGTFDTFRTASFAFDAARTAATTLAPGTDIDEGIAAVARLVRS